MELEKIDYVIMSNMMTEKMKVIVFDTETTGLPTERNPSITQPWKWPHIVQISYVLYDTESRKMLACQDHIIKVNDDVEITKRTVRRSMGSHLLGANGKGSTSILHLMTSIALFAKQTLLLHTTCHSTNG